MRGHIQKRAKDLRARKLELLPKRMLRPALPFGKATRKFLWRGKECYGAAASRQFLSASIDDVRLYNHALSGFRHHGDL